MSCSPSVLRFVVGEYASILADCGDAFSGVELVTPTSEHFPDAFHRDEASVLALLERTMSYTPLSDELAVRLGFVEGEAEEKGGGSCSKPGCGGGGSGWSRIDGAMDEGDAYRVVVHVADTTSPARLVGSLARSVGALLSYEAGVEPDADIGPRSEVWASAAGMGVLLLGAAHVYSKSCGGVNMHQGTALDVDALATMLALFCAVNGIKPSKAAKHLQPTAREAFDEAWQLVDSNPEIVRKLKKSPELLVGGAFELEPPKGILRRIFAKKSEEEEDSTAPTSAPRKERTAEEQRRLDEARALVDDIFPTR